MMQRAYSVLDVKELVETDDHVQIRGIASTPTTDRMGDVVEPMGAKFKTPMPLLWQHRSDQPVGQVTFAQPTKKGIPFEAQIPLVKEAGNLKDRIDEAVQSIRYGLVSAVSIGFAAVDGMVERIETGLRFKEWEWLELSLVTIPANAEAVITAVKAMDYAALSAIGQAREIMITGAKSVPEHSAGASASSDTRKGAVKLIPRIYAHENDCRSNPRS